MSVGLNREAKSSSESEVSEFDHASFGHQQILRLEIAMHTSVCVAEVQRLEELICEFLDFLESEWALDVFEVLLEVEVDVFED